MNDKAKQALADYRAKVARPTKTAVYSVTAQSTVQAQDYLTLPSEQQGVMH